MKHKKQMGMPGYVTSSILAGTVTGTLESATGQGTGMTAKMMEGAAVPIQPVMKIKGTQMVLNSLGKLKNPLKGGIRKRR